MNVARRQVPISDVKKKRGFYAGGIADSGGSSASSSATDVDMYLDVPSFELSLDEFEEYALARLKVCYTLRDIWQYLVLLLQLFGTFGGYSLLLS